MPTTFTNLFPPPLRGLNLPTPLQQWLFTLQNLFPLALVDTSAGNYAEVPPPPGLNNATGQSNQNQEITYVKKSSDGHVFTLNGVQGSPFTLTGQFQRMKIKSDGTNWWRTA